MCISLLNRKLELRISPNKDEEARFLEAVQRGIDAAIRGEFIDEEEMAARIEAMFKR